MIKVKLQMNFWTGTTEFSGTVFHHSNLWCKESKKIQCPSSVFTSFKLVLCPVEKWLHVAAASLKPVHVVLVLGVIFFLQKIFAHFFFLFLL